MEFVWKVYSVKDGRRHNTQEDIAICSTEKKAQDKAFEYREKETKEMRRIRPSCYWETGSDTGYREWSHYYIDSDINKVLLKHLVVIEKCKVE
jgi:hypothetical protein